MEFVPYTAAPGEKLSPWRHDENGNEILDPTPMQPPLGYRKAPTLSEQIAQQVRRMKLEILRDDSVGETDEEADDFEVGEDFEPLSQYENDHIPTIAELKRRAKEINDAIAERNRVAAIEAHENALKKPASVTNPPAQPPAPKVEPSKTPTSD